VHKKTENSFGKCQLELTRSQHSLCLNFDIPNKGALGIFGQSGSGKTSILRCIAGLEKQVKGHIEIGKEIWLNNKGIQKPVHQRSIGFVFQDSRLFPHMNVNQNIHYGKLRRETNSDISFETVIELLGLEQLLTSEVQYLSGGEKQRVAIARALLSQPKLLLMDEPLASLDDIRKQEVLIFLDKLRKNINIPMIYVSHRSEEIQHLCEKVLVIDQGQKVFEGSMEKALVSPEAPFASAPKASVLLSGTVLQYIEESFVSIVALKGGEQLYLPHQLNSKDEINIRIFASDVSLSLKKPEKTSILNSIPGQVKGVVANSKHHLTLLISIGEQDLLGRISRKSFQDLSLKEDSNVYVQVKALSIDRL